MNFNWERFCEDYRIPFLRHGEGPGIGQGKIAIRCPYCDDHAEHMGLNLDPSEPWWNCWRCRAAGGNPAKLVCKLTGSNMEKAQSIVAEHDVRSADDFDHLFDKPPPTMAKKAAAHRKAKNRLPDGCHPLAGANPALSARFIEYLAKARGFGKDVAGVAEAFKLHYALHGEQAWRIVYPITAGGELAAWVGRSIYQDATLRYKTSADGSIKSCIGNYDSCLIDQSKKGLVIVEGPLDMLKLDYYGRPLGLRACCTFGLSWTQKQFGRLLELAKASPRVYVMYDQGAYLESGRLAEELSAFSPRAVKPLEMRGRKDPGDMSPADIGKLAARLEAQP